VKGPWLALTAAGPLLRRGSAVVLNASNNANLGMPGPAPTNAALRSFARTTASELAERPIRVRAVNLRRRCAGPRCNRADKAALKLASLGRPVKKMIGGVTGWLDDGVHARRGLAVTLSAQACSGLLQRPYG